jgi:predicted nuclease of restriction endonuclease-like (RecB) superfamily
MKLTGTIIVFLVLAGLLYPDKSFAQEVISQSEPSKKELKISNQLEKAKIDLAKAQANLLQYKRDYNKKRTKFQKDNSKGKLSPNTVAKHAKVLDNLNKKIDRELATIDKLEKFILKNDIGAGSKNLP